MFSVCVLCSQDAVPFAVVGANTIIEVKGRKVRGRMYPWGVVEVENPEHCDFIKLRTMLMYVSGKNIYVCLVCLCVCVSYICI